MRHLIKSILFLLVLSTMAFSQVHFTGRVVNQYGQGERYAPVTWYYCDFFTQSLGCGFTGNYSQVTQYTNGFGYFYFSQTAWVGLDIVAASGKDGTYLAPIQMDQDTYLNIVLNP